MNARHLLLLGWLMPAAIGLGQAPTPEALASAQAAAEQAEKEWFAPALGLDAKLAPLLPCDPTAKASIQAVSKASDARVATLMNYLRLLAAQAAEQTKGARMLLQAEEARALDTTDERTDASLERTAIEAQSATLSISADSKPSLSEARSELGQITDIAVRRMGLVDQNAATRNRGMAALRDLLAAHQARETALKQELDAYQAEAARWNTYYSLRLARTQAECTAIEADAAPSRTPARRPATKGKKKQ